MSYGLQVWSTYQGLSESRTTAFWWELHELFAQDMSRWWTHSYNKGLKIPVGKDLWLIRGSEHVLVSGALQVYKSTQNWGLMLWNEWYTLQVAERKVNSKFTWLFSCSDWQCIRPQCAEEQGTWFWDEKLCHERMVMWMANTPFWWCPESGAVGHHWMITGSQLVLFSGLNSEETWTCSFETTFLLPRL